jgi:hypothetical protein
MDKKDYISYLEKMIEQEKEALENCRKNSFGKEVEAAIQRRLNSFEADLEKAKKL